MAKRLYGSYALALALSQALWVLPGAREAVAHPSGDPSCYTPPFTLLLSPCVPHDLPAGQATGTSDLAVFAWQEFIALNWVAMDPGTTGIRGRAAPDTDPLTGFLDIAPGNYPLLVWQTYRHKNELFPYGKSADTNFDSNSPTYSYETQPTPATGGPIPSFTLFNNLDETSQIGLTNLYAYAASEIQPPATVPPAPPYATGTRIAYEAKVNRAVFNYISGNGYSNPAAGNGYQSYGALSKARNNTQGYDTNGNYLLPTYGGRCDFPNGSTPQSIILLPCGSIATPGDPGEGAIEIKAAWRKLMPDEVSSGRFFMQNVIYYTGSQGKQQYNNEVWGLIALHIIHKTITFPGFVFATFEQIDNYLDDNPDSPNPETLAFQNLQTQDGGTPIENTAVRRAHPIPAAIAAINVDVQNVFKNMNSNTVWQYYKLIGVQATPVSGPPAAGASLDDLSYYYLANIVVETNQTLQNFFGHVGGDGLAGAFENVVLHGPNGTTLPGSPFTMGGCQGCHGFQGQYSGGDMSVLIARAGANAQKAESIDASPLTSVRTVIYRAKDLIKDDGYSLPKFDAAVKGAKPPKHH